MSRHPIPAASWRASLSKIVRESGATAALDAAAEWLGQLSARADEADARLAEVRRVAGPHSKRPER